MRHLLEVARVISFYMHVPKSYWSNAVLIACYFMSRMPSTILGGHVPHRVLFSNHPLTSLPPRVFGCTCYVYGLDPGRDKLDPQAIKCVFLGYSRTGYKC